MNHIWFAEDGYGRIPDSRAKYELPYGYPTRGAEGLLRLALKGRRFFMDPDYERAARIGRKPPLSYLPIVFSMEGGPVEGLELGRGFAIDWRFWIPKGPERNEIEEALLEKGQLAAA